MRLKDANDTSSKDPKIAMQTKARDIRSTGKTYLFFDALNAKGIKGTIVAI